MFCSHVPPSEETKENPCTVIMKKKDNSTLAASDEISFRPWTKLSQNNIELATASLKTKSVAKVRIKKEHEIAPKARRGSIRKQNPNDVTQKLKVVDRYFVSHNSMQRLDNGQ